jgi:hypothetical protein
VTFDRRRFLAGAAALAVGGAAAAERLTTGAAGAEPAAAPADGQHRWDATLARDAHGNAVSPRHDRLLLFDLRRDPTRADRATLEDALHALEQRFPHGPHGLLVTVGWGPRYFHRLRVPSPVPVPEPLSSFELPTLDAYEVCVHLAGDDERRLAEAQSALLDGTKAFLRHRETRTGFTGAGLPAAHQDVGGIPFGRPVAEGAPLYMGFKSGYRKNQASEDDVTIASGPFAGGTTMHVSRMRLRLDSWYALDERERVARMFAPQVTPKQVPRFTTDAPSDPAGLDRAASHYGVVGHSQSSARARRHGKPLILRRDFDTADGGEAGLHFVCLQRTIADFVTTRKAMNAARAAFLNPEITPTDNNGINEFIFVTHRANYVLPPRQLRSFPLLRA